jgi:hypothetical protein
MVSNWYGPNPMQEALIMPGKGVLHTPWKAAHCCWAPLLSMLHLHLPHLWGSTEIKWHDLHKTLGKNKCFVAPPLLDFHIANGFWLWSQCQLFMTSRWNLVPCNSLFTSNWPGLPELEKWFLHVCCMYILELLFVKSGGDYAVRTASFDRIGCQTCN